MNIRRQASFAKLLQRHGLKVTGIRLAILDYLSETEDHPSSETIYRTLMEQGIHCVPASIYNNVNVLKEKGVLKDLHLGDTEIRYDAMLEPHSHFYCKKCRRVWNTSIQPPVLEEKILPGFQVDDSELIYHGICSDCLFIEGN
ncbi:MAG TPA: transcriptional repressor [Clostridiaceae bacterium]|nr:transcriptional repressor [Clostridiaceae bacterium]